MAVAVGAVPVGELGDVAAPGVAAGANDADAVAAGLAEQPPDGHAEHQGQRRAREASASDGSTFELHAGLPAGSASRNDITGDLA
jgi:hypothetical protein